jgi:hypothetical protein
MLFAPVEIAGLGIHSPGVWLLHEEALSPIKDLQE